MTSPPDSEPRSILESGVVTRRQKPREALAASPTCEAVPPDRHSRHSLSVSVALTLLLAIGLTGWGRQASHPESKRDVYFLQADTLRAGHLDLHGYERPTSPNLDHFADSATVFERVVAAAPWTLPSVGSVMTGVYPSVHGLRARAHSKGMTALGPAVTTLAEVPAGEGYRTVAIVTNPWMTTAAHGLARGFEEYIPFSMVNAPAVNERACEVIAKDDPRPLFLDMHCMDPHGPYDRHADASSSALGSLPANSDRELTRKELSAQRLRHGREGEWETARWQDSGLTNRAPSGHKGPSCFLPSAYRKVAYDHLRLPII